MRRIMKLDSFRQCDIELHAFIRIDYSACTTSVCSKTYITGLFHTLRKDDEPDGRLWLHCPQEVNGWTAPLNRQQDEPWL